MHKRHLIHIGFVVGFQFSLLAAAAGATGAMMFLVAMGTLAVLLITASILLRLKYQDEEARWFATIFASALVSAGGLLLLPVA